MPEEPPQISVLDARLAEIDRRLSSIQTGLAVAAEEPEPSEPVDPPPAPADPPPAPVDLPAAELPPRVEVAEPDPPPPSPSEAATLLDELRRLAAAHEQLLESTRILLAASERVLARLAPRESGAPMREFSVSAGPFPSTEELRQFQRTLAEIPQVRGVSVRGFEGEDRAIVDVQLFEPNA